MNMDLKNSTPQPRGSICWENIRNTLLVIQQTNPIFLEENNLIGGSAAWFFRTYLENENDSDFPPIAYTASEETQWYSKDIDFMGTSRDKLAEELGVVETGTPPRVLLNEVWIDVLDQGIILNKDNCKKTRIDVESGQTGVNYYIASPILLYREKKELEKLAKNQKLTLRPQDNLHSRVLLMASRLLLCQLIEKPELSIRNGNLLYKLLKEAQELAPEVLDHPRVQSRLKKQLPKIEKLPQHKKLYHLLKNQIIQKQQ